MTQPDPDAPLQRSDLGDVERLLERTAQAEREVMAAAQSVAGDAASVERTLARIQASERRRPVRGLLLAAAAVVVALGAWWLLAEPRGADGPSGTTLGSPELELVHPGALAERFDRVEWTARNGEQALFSLRISDSSDGTLLLEKKNLRGTSYSLDAVDTTAWTEIEIEIERFDTLGADPQASDSVVSRRSSP